MSEIELAMVVDRLANLSEERKIIEKEEKALKEQLKIYMTKNSLTEFLGNNSIAKLEDKTRKSLIKEYVVDFLKNNGENPSDYTKVTYFKELTCRRLK